MPPGNELATIGVMKIDDPKVQAYIKGDLSHDQEEDFRAELAGHPEVADLAETLKKTAALMAEDRATGQKPYGLDLTKKTAQRLFDDDEEPEAAWARFFHSVMGKSWRFGVFLLGVTLIVFVFAFLVVPFVRSLQAPTEVSEETLQLEELERAAETNRKSSQGSQNRNIPTHASKNIKVNQSMAEAFSRSLDPSSAIVSPEVIQTLSDLTKVSSTGGPSMDSGSYQLPITFEAELQNAVKTRVLENKTWNKKAVQADAFANSYFQRLSSNKTEGVQVFTEWRAAPWDSRQTLLMLDVQAPMSRRETFSPDQIRLVLKAESGGDIQSTLEKRLQDQSPVVNISQNFSEQLSQQLELASKHGQKFILVADGSLTPEQADYFLLSTERFPHLKFAFLSLVPDVDESHFKVRSKLRTQKVGEYYTAATPSQLYRSVRATLQGSEQVFGDFRWSIEFDKEFVSSSELVGQVSSEIQVKDITPTHWLMSNDRTVVFFLLKLREVLPHSHIGTVRASWRQEGKAGTQSLMVPLRRTNASIMVPEATYRFAVAVIQVGLMLKGELPMSSKALQTLRTLVLDLDVEENLRTQKSEFLKLVTTLLVLQ